MSAARVQAAVAVADEAGIVKLAADLSAGRRRAIAEALNLLEDRRIESRARAASLLEALDGDRLERSGHVIGITGPPGVGKSTLIAALVRAWRLEGRRVGVLAVDPSSPISGGALLGDRLRMLQPEPDEGVFIRSLAGRGELGGLGADAFLLSRALLAAFDVVVVETIGIGQAEIDVVLQTDTTCLVAQPGSGDTVQAMKAGIFELPAVVVVNKADLGALAHHAAGQLRAGLPPGEGGRVAPPVLLVSALKDEGIDALVSALSEHRDRLAQRGELLRVRQRQAAVWGLKRLLIDYGRFGVQRLGGNDAVIQRWQTLKGSPLARLAALRLAMGDGGEP